MIELISREQAIDALVAETIYTEEELREYYEANSHRDEWVNGIYDAVEAIKQLPPIQPIQPKRGRWIYCEDSMADCVDGYRCDQCGFFVPWDYKHKGIDFIQDYNFCPNCGAKMDEVTT